MAQIKLLGKTRLEGKIIFDTGYWVSDANAASYIAAVEAADGTTLEDPVKQAIDQFIIGCKSDGIWSALKASCILAGARTLNGALVPLVGTAPTNFNFVSGDYNRKTGLKGDGSTKNLNSNRNNNSDPQNSKHVSVYASEVQIATLRQYIGANNTFIQIVNTACDFRLNSSSASRASINSVGLIGLTRTSATEYIARGNKTNFTLTNSSAVPANAATRFFANTNGSSNTATTARLSFYSIGEHLDLTALDTRVTTLMTALNSAI